MTTDYPTDIASAVATTEHGERGGERGSALFIAMIMILILTFVGFAFLTRTLLVSQIAGAERWTTKAFYAADAGMNVAKLRLRVRETRPCTFNVEDLRGYAGSSDKGDVVVAVSEMNTIGLPQMILGSQIPAGEGAGAEALYTMSYRGTSSAFNLLSRSEALVSSTQSVSPVPLSIPMS